MSVVHHDCPAISIHEISHQDDTIRRSNHASAVFAGDIHTAMEGAFTVKRINAFAKFPGDRTFHRPKGRGSSHAQPVAHRRIAQSAHANTDGRGAAHRSISHFGKL